jgi:hypothetical protein
MLALLTSLAVAAWCLWLGVLVCIEIVKGWTP